MDGILLEEFGQCYYTGSTVCWSVVIILYRTLLQVILKSTLKRLPHRILSLESTTNPEGAGDE